MGSLFYLGPAPGNRLVPGRRRQPNPYAGTTMPMRAILVSALPRSACLLIGLTACARSPERWRADLNHPDPFARGMAAIGLALEAPDQAEPLLGDLLRLVDSTGADLEREAAWVLHGLGPLHAQSLLDAMVADELMSAECRGTIQNALVAGGADVAQRVVKCMRGPGKARVGDLGDVLLGIGGPAVPAIATLLTEEPDVRLQRFAAFLLVRLGRAARPALPALRQAAQRDDPELRTLAEQALQSFAGGAR